MFKKIGLAVLVFGLSVAITTVFWLPLRQAALTVLNIPSSATRYLAGIFASQDNFKPAGEVSFNELSDINSSKENQNSLSRDQVVKKENQNQKSSLSNQNNFSLSSEYETSTGNSKAQESETISQKNNSTSSKSTIKTIVKSVVQKNNTTTSEKLALENIKSISTSTFVTVTASKCSFLTTQSVQFQGVIINEVAWMGTTNSANDEWIELRNISGNDIGLNGWQLIGKDEDIRIVFGTNDKIAAGNFFILERTDDNTLPAITANKIYKGSLANTNDGLRLFNNQCNLVDEVLAVPNWPGGDNSTKETMERNNSDFNWHTSSVAGGTPNKTNSDPEISSGGGGGTADNSSLIEEIPTNTPVSQSSGINHVVISEIRAGTDADANSEFIELYNPTDDVVNLNGWELRKRTSSGSESNLVNQSAFTGAIQPKGFFLVASHSYNDSKQPDLLYSATSANIAYSGNTILIYNGDHSTASVIDEVNYSEIPKDKSLERKVYQDDSCVSAQDNGEYLGNGCDTDSPNDFEIRDLPNPQNSQSLPEPRFNSAVQNFSVAYSSSTMELIFNWDAPTTTPSTTYEIRDISSSSPGIIIFNSSGTTTFREPITEINRDYSFSIQYFDSEGMFSESASTSVSIPSSTPIRENPVMSGELIIDFDRLNSLIGIFWPPATVSGTPDPLLTYEISFASSSEEWQPVGNATTTEKQVSLGDVFDIKVRAEDSFGNYSDPPLEKTWSYPAD